MPGYATWRELYQEEYEQLSEEGYSVEGCPAPDLEERLLPLPESAASREELSTEELWESAYRILWSVREKGIRPDYPYWEPEEFGEIMEAADAPPLLETLSPESYRERIAGAWFGRCAGVVLGKPLEMGYNRLKIRDYLESTGSYPLNDWIPGYSEKLRCQLRQDCVPSTRGKVAFVQADDDIHYTVLALLLAERKGLSFTKLDVGKNWLENIPYHWLWCASRQTYYHLVSQGPALDEASAEGLNMRLNPWRECIDGQIRGDFWGYIFPGEPHEAARLAYQESSNSLVKNGVYGAMFVAGCLSAALSPEPSLDKILAGGLSVIPKASRLAEAVRLVCRWYRECGGWIPVCDRIYERYGKLPFAGTVNNLSVVVLALLHGNLDYTKTITTAVMCGMDTDCNSGTAGSIVGAALGIKGIDPRWHEPLNNTVKSVVAGFGQGTVSELIDRTVAVRQKFQMA